MELGTPLIDGDQILLGGAGQSGLFVLDRYSGTHLHTYPSMGSVQSRPRVDGDTVIFTDSAATAIRKLKTKIIAMEQLTKPFRLLDDGNGCVAVESV